MIKLLFASASLAALAATGALANGLTYAGAEITYASRDGGDYQDSYTKGFATVERGRLTYSISADRSVELKRNGANSDYNNGALELSVSYEVADGLDLGVGVGRYASTQTAYNYYGLGANYSNSTVMVGASVIKFDERYYSGMARVEAVAALAPNFTVGALADHYWAESGKKSRTDYALAANYSAGRLDLTAYGEWERNGDDNRFALAGVYELTNGFSVVGAVGTHVVNDKTFNQTAAGLRYNVNDQVSFEALYANSRHKGSNFPGFGLSVSWNFGKPTNATEAMSKYRRDAISTAYGFF